MEQLRFITGNQGKFKEAQLMFPDLIQQDIDLIEIQSLNPQEIIEYKLDEAIKLGLDYCFVEDTSLVIYCMGAMPGPLIKWFLKSVGCSGIRDIIKHQPDHTATVIVMIGAIIKGEKMFFSSQTQGKIIEPTGNGGFGWDPLFVPDGENISFGQMTVKQKSPYNSRLAALKKLKNSIEI